MSGDILNFGPRRRRRAMSLTPMIDVVFLLLIFFMLSSRFGLDAVLPVAGGAEGFGSEWQGAPRLIDIGPDSLSLNGVEMPVNQLATELGNLMPEQGAAVILRPREDADLQRLVDVMDGLRDRGFNNMILVE